jgi:hypothetical protein
MVNDQSRFLGQIKWIPGLHVCGVACLNIYGQILNLREAEEYYIKEGAIT